MVTVISLKCNLKINSHWREDGLHDKDLAIQEKPTSQKLSLRSSSGLYCWSDLWLGGTIFLTHNPSLLPNYSIPTFLWNATPSLTLILFASVRRHPPMEMSMFMGEHFDPVLENQHNPKIPSHKNYSRRGSWLRLVQSELQDVCRSYD